MSNDLTELECTLIESLPKPPTLAAVRLTNIWIIEWLSPGERKTGNELHQWMKQKRHGWSIYNPCTSKNEVIRSIAHAADLASQSGVVPVLHIEAHGGPEGLAPSRDAEGELLHWTELTIPLQKLNTATNCNLILVVVTCFGFAAIQALTQGLRAPAVALIGPNATVNESDLFLGAKELYRRFMDKNPELTCIAESASREMRTSNFEIEPFAMLAYEALVEQLVRETRPDEHQACLERLRQCMHQQTAFSTNTEQVCERIVPNLFTFLYVV